MSVTTERIETLVWVFIYGGLFLVALGAALHRAGQSLGVVSIAGGGAFIVVGAVLVWVRSRLPPGGPQP